MEGRVSGVVSDRIHENRTALAAIPQQREPEIGTLARSPECSPSASHEREVQENECVCSTKPDLDSIIRPQVPIHDPPVLLDEHLLDLHPLIARCRDKAWPPENLVQLTGGKKRASAVRGGAAKISGAKR